MAPSRKSAIDLPINLSFKFFPHFYLFDFRTWKKSINFSATLLGPGCTCPAAPPRRAQRTAVEASETSSSSSGAAGTNAAGLVAGGAQAVPRGGVTWGALLDG